MDDHRKEQESLLKEEETKLERIADELVESAEINAWEYGNTGNFLYN